MPLAKDVDIKELAKDTDGFSGADIEALCREAALYAMRKNVDTNEVTKSDFNKASKDITPSVTKDTNQFYENILQKRRSAKLEDEASYTG